MTSESVKAVKFGNEATEWTAENGYDNGEVLGTPFGLRAQLLAGTAMRFSDLKRALPQVSQKMLIQRLRDLEEDGIVSRTLYPQVPPKVEYCLTEVGKGLRPVFIALLDWTELLRSTISIEEPIKA